MKKRFIGFLLIFMLLLSMGSVASAANTAGLIYDETEELLSEDAQYMGNEYFYTVVNETGVALYIDIYTSIAGADSLYEATEFVYVNSNFGYGDDKIGLLLSLYAVADGDSWVLDKKEPYALYTNGIPEGMADAVLLAAEPFINSAAWTGNLSNDQLIVTGLAAAVGNAVLNFDPQAQSMPPAVEPTTEAVTESYARYTPFEGKYLIDSYGLLTEAEQQAIESYAKQFSNKHSCNVYAMIVDDYKQLNGNNDIFKANYTYYHDNNLGYGEKRDGVFLLLSMNKRDFALFVYGDNAEHAFNSWGQRKLEEAFIGNLGENRWYDGLENYLETFDEFLTLAEQGDPVREPPQSKMALSTGISSFIALLASSFMWNKNKKVQKRSSAYGYMVGSLVPDIVEDRYINTVVSTRIIESSSDNSSSSVSRSGGGGSGRSGKF